MSEKRAELSELARASTVNRIRPELVECAAHEFEVTPEEKIVAEVTLDAEADEAAGQFDAGDTAILKLCAFAAGANAEKRKLMALCVGDELAGGERNAIDLMEGFTEERDARDGVHKPLCSVP